MLISATWLSPKSSITILFCSNSLSWGRYRNKLDKGVDAEQIMRTWKRGNRVDGVTSHTLQVEGKNKSENKILFVITQSLDFAFKMSILFLIVCIFLKLFLNCIVLVKTFPHSLYQPVKKGAKILLGNFRPEEASARPSGSEPRGLPITHEGDVYIWLWACLCA